MNLSMFDPQSVLPKNGPVKPSLEKAAYQQIREQIIRGDYLPGTLLSENELADLLNMSRTPIRAAISLLETEGFLESIRGRGVFVKDITFREFNEMFEVLVSMQLYCLDIAAKRKLTFDLAALRRYVDRQTLAADDGDNLTYYESSLMFVGTMLSTVRNETMMQILEKIKGKYMFKIVSFRKMHSNMLAKPNHARKYNLRVCEALERGDIEEAKRAIFELNELVYEQMNRLDI